MYGVIRVLTLLVVYMMLPSVLGQGCNRSYVVGSGDTCDGICIKQNVSTFQLALENPSINADCSNLFPGETLCLGLVGKDCTITHVVVGGESCLSISNNVNISLSTLLANNPNINAGCTNIRVEEVLCIAPNIIPY